MNRIKSFGIIGILVIAILFLSIRMWNSGSSDPVMVIKKENASPKKFDRNWRELKLKEIEFKGAIKDSLYEPVTIRKDANDNLYITDFGDMRVKKFTKDGDYITAIGKGEGRGPAENLLIIDVTVDRDTIYIIDSRKFTLSTFTTDGKYIDSFSLKKQPYRITKTEIGPVVHVFPSDKLFMQLDNKGQIINEFGTILEDQVSNAFSLDGNIVKNPYGGIIYVPKHASLNYYFNKKGELQKIARRPDGLNFPGVINRSTEDRKMLMAPTSKFEAGSFSLDDDIIYIDMLFRNEGTSNSTAIDKYNLEDGTYIDSFKLPFQVGNFQIIDDTMYVVYKRTFTAYKLLE